MREGEDDKMESREGRRFRSSEAPGSDGEVRFQSACQDKPVKGFTQKAGVTKVSEVNRLVI